MIKCIAIAAALLLGFTTFAQQTSRTEKSTNAGQQVNHPGQETSAAQQQVANTTGTANYQSSTSPRDTSSTGDTPASNTPAVSQSTSSSSGSPAVLSDGKGKGRDGTNNVQRASMNMAGSPAGNLNLDAVQTVDVDSELRDRQGASQEKQASAQQGTSGDGPDAGAINENSRRENNSLSDQNLSSKDKSNKGLNQVPSQKKKGREGRKAPGSKEKG